MSEHTPSPQSVVVPVAVLNEAAGVLDCEGYGPLSMSLLSCLSAPAPSSLAGGEALGRITQALVEADEEFGGMSAYRRRVLSEAILAALSPEAPAREGEVQAIVQAEYDHWIKAAMKHKRPAGLRSDHAQADLERAKVAKRILDKIAALTLRHEAPADTVTISRAEYETLKSGYPGDPSLLHEAPAALCDHGHTDPKALCSDCEAASVEAPAEPCKSCNGTGRELGSAFNRCSDCEAPAEGAGEDWRAEYDRVERIGIEAQRQDELARGTNDPISKSEHEAQASGHWARYERECAKMNAKALRARSSAPEAREDYSSLIAARCVALPGKLIDCPVCLAVDKERDRQAAPSADKLREAARKVLDGLNARIEAASMSAVPVFDGIADLHDALKGDAK